MSSAACALINAALGVDCDNPIVPGVNDRLILFNHDDISGYTYNSGNKGSIASITMKSGKVGYAFQGKSDSVEAMAELVKARFSTNFDHEVIARVFDNSVSVKDQIALLANAKIVAVVQNNHVNTAGDSAFEVYGKEAGLELLECTRNPTDVESEGGWYLKLRTPERSKEPRVPATFLATDFAGSKTALDNLL